MLLSYNTIESTFSNLAATKMHQLAGDFYTTGEILGHALAGINAPWACR